MWEQGRSHVINSHNWSLHMSLLLFTGLALVMALPPGGQAALISDYGLNLRMLFPIVYIVLYGIVAMNFGQNAASNGQSVLKPLIIQLAFALFITAPYWIVFKTIIYASWLQIFWGIGHLFIYGLVFALFGLLLVTLPVTASEITQFNVKYAVFAGFLLSTFFIGAAHPLSPFHALSFIFVGSQTAGFFLKGYGALALIGAFLLFLIRRFGSYGERSNAH